MNSLIFEALKLSQVVGSLFLHIRANANQDSGNSTILERVIQGASATSGIHEAFKELQRNTFYSTLLFPFFPFQYPVKNGKTERVVLKVLQDSLKKSNEVVKVVMGILPYVD